MRNKGKKLQVFVLPFVSISCHGELTDVICLCAWLPGCLACVWQEGIQQTVLVERARVEWSRVEQSVGVLSVSDVPTRHHHPAPPSTPQHCLAQVHQLETGVWSVGLPSLPVDSEPEHTQTIRMFSVENNWTQKKNHQTSRYLLLELTKFFTD